VTVVGFFLVLLLVLPPGIAVWFNFEATLKRRLRGLETLFLWLLAGIAIVSWLAFTLAEFPGFRCHGWRYLYWAALFC
jgi:hypothetical protein